MTQKQKKPQKYKYVRLVTIITATKFSAKDLRELIIDGITVQFDIADEPKVSVRNVDTDK